MFPSVWRNSLLRDSLLLLLRCIHRFSGVRTDTPTAVRVQQTARSLRENRAGEWSRERRRQQQAVLCSTSCLVGDFEKDVRGRLTPGGTHYLRRLLFLSLLICIHFDLTYRKVVSFQSLPHCAFIARTIY